VADEIKNEKGPTSNYADNFDRLLPRDIHSASMQEDREDKQGSSSFTGTVNTSAFMGMQPSANILRNPARRFYDPEITTTAIYLPKDIKRNNRWCRWFYDHDEMIGAILDVHAELPYSRARMKVDDPVIQRVIDECIDKTNFFSMLPSIDLEYMKVGEVFIYTHWNEALGMWDSIVLHNPDFVEVRYSPFADREPVLELTPNEELRSLVHSTKPEEQQLKKRLPQDIIKRVLTGRNIILNYNETTHIARRSNPYDLRGTSILRRLFRLLQYEDKLREAQLTISDNFIYPLKIFKLGDENKGWIPNASHQKALAQMLQQANFDPNFSLIYHYGLKVDVITVADKLLKMDQEWTEINKKKCMALGVSEEFLTKGESYAAANVGLQTQLARYKAKRDLFEIKWIRDKFFRVMAEKNGWYKRDAREIVGHYRVTRKGEELNKRIILPNIIWDKKLVLRDDQQYLTFLNNVYANGKGPVSVLTLLMAMGLTLDEELSNKEKQKELEEKFGLKTITPVQGGGGAPMGNLASKVMDKLKFGKKKEDLHEEAKASEYVRPDGDFVKPDNIGKYGSYTEADENKYSVEISKDLVLIDDQDWKNSLRSKNIPQEVITILGIYNDKLESIFKRSNGKFASEVQLSSKDLTDILGKIYLQGKLSAYESTNFLQVSRNIYAKEIKDFSDILLVEEFGNWITLMTEAEMDKSAILKNLRTLGNTCFGYGQLKGYQEQDIEKVKLSNVLENDGMKYEIKDLLSKRHNLSSLISPRGDIVVLAACIEESETVDSHIERYKDFISNGIRVSSCPVEFIRPTKQYLEKVGKVLKKKYDNIIFVKDIVDLPEWEEYTKKGIEKDLSGLDRDSRMLTLSSSLMYEKLKKRGNLAIFNNNKDLYIANWIGTQDKSIVDNFIKNIDIYQDVEKLIDKAFEKKAYDLTRNELETYRVFGYIEPVLSNSEIMGWKAAESRETVSNEKIRLGKIWNAEGICINNNDKDSKAFFFDNLKLWIEYTHKLDEPTVQSFNKIFF